MNGKSKVRLWLMVILAAVCGYVGFLVYKERDPLVPLAAAEKAYEGGQQLEKQKDFKAASDKYEQANVLLDHALKRLNGPHGLEEAQLKEVSSNVLFLKAKSIRDKHFALAEASGKAIPETKDSVTNQSYRNILSIPDSKEREDAKACIRGATMGYSKDYDVHLEALRLELMTTPIPWDQVEKLSRAILEIKPDDSRAKYLMAKYEFEQPQPGRAYILPENRSLERIKNAKAYIDDVRRDKTFPMWRTEYLAAQIQYWHLNRARVKKDAEFNTALSNLEASLLDELSGALPRIRRGEGLEHVGSWDTDALLNLHALAADIAVEIIRKKKHSDNTLLSKVFRDTLAFCEKRIATDDPVFTRPMVISALLNLMSKSQSFLAAQSSTQYEKEWQAGLDMLRPLLREEFKSDRCDPYRVAQFAELLMREAQLQKKRAPQSDWDKLALEAKQWFDDGLKFGKEKNLTNLQMAPFNMLAVNVFFFNTDKRENLTPYLDALTATKNHPQAQALALVIDGACDEREGRLEKAAWKLERARKIAGGEEEVRAYASLANIYMAMGMPDHALDALTHLRDVYDRFNDLSELERDWIKQFLRQPQDFFALTAIANMESARKAINSFKLKNPKAKVPDQFVKDKEDRVRNLLSKHLPIVTGPGFMARISWVNYLTATRQRRLAEEELYTLAKAYPNRFELLTLKIGITQVEAIEALEAGDVPRAEAIIKRVDEYIHLWMFDHPADKSAKLYKALWLAQTKRGDDARAYLAQIAAEFPNNKEFDRVFTAITLSHGGGSAMRLLRHLPRDPQIDHLLTRIGQKVGDDQAKLRAALTRFESNGIARIMQAEELFFNGEYSKAADAYASALDFTRIKSMAQQGVIRSMFALAAQDSEKALQQNQRLLFEFPKEPCVLLSYAYVFLVRDHIGSPTHNWEESSTRNMGSALNVWEQRMKDELADNHAMIALTQAEFWYRANRMDVARERTAKALSIDPNNPNILVACIHMILDDPGRDMDPKLRGYMHQLKRVAAEGPENPMTNFLAARVEEYEGNWQKAVEYYEESLRKFPKDRSSAIRLVSLLDSRGEHARALHWAKYWHAQVPNDLQAVSAEIRMLCRLNQVDQARTVAFQFLAKAMVSANQAAQGIKDDNPVKQKEARDGAILAARCQAEIEFANGFFLGGAFQEAEKRLLQLPKDFLNLPISQELLAEVYVKQNQFAKAEKVFEGIVEKDKSNFVAVNNLAYLLAEYQKKPNQARDIILTSLKGKGTATSQRAADRFPPEFLATIGKVYMKLDNPAYGKEMMSFFKPASERYPRDPRILLYYGYANELAGEYVKANLFYERAMQSHNHIALSPQQRAVLENDIAISRARLLARSQSANR
jgi:predicted Zn-dependent protease